MSAPQLPGEPGAARLTRVTSRPQQGEGEWACEMEEGVALKGISAAE